MITVVLSYTLSEAGRKEALRLGLNAKERQTFCRDIEDTSVLDLPGILVGQDGIVYIEENFTLSDNPYDVARRFLYQRDMPFQDFESALSSFAENAKKALEESKAKEAEKKAQRQAEIEEAVALVLKAGPEGCVEFRHDQWQRISSPAWEDERCCKLRDSADRLATKKNVEVEAKALAEKAANLAKREAEEKALGDGIAKWVKDNGTKGQKERFKEGCLPRSEVFAEVEECIFSPLVQSARYERMSAEDFCTCETDCPGAEFDSAVCTELSQSVFDQLKKFRDLVPVATAEVRLHTGHCDACGGHAERHGIKMTAVWCGKRFVREYAVS